MEANLPVAKPTYLTVLPEKVINLNKEHGLGKGGSLFKAHEIRVMGKPSLRGLGMHAVTKDTVAIEYSLQGQYRTFVGGVAIDDSSREWGGSKSALVFKIIGDGKDLWKSNPVGSHGKVTDFRVPVAGVKTLRLAVECPGDSSAGTAVWLDPRLVE